MAESYDKEMIDAGINGRIQLCNGITYPMYSDIRKLKNITREARQRMAQHDAGLYISVVGILSNSKVQSVIYNFFNTIYKAPVPAKMFTSEQDALNWLKPYIVAQ